MVTWVYPEMRAQPGIYDNLYNLDISIVHGARVRYSTILEEQLLHLITLMDEKSHAISIINNQVRYTTLTIILCPYQGIQVALIVIIKTLTLPGKHSRIFITRNVRYIINITDGGH